jgi:hypothetical protein
VFRVSVGAADDHQHDDERDHERDERAGEWRRYILAAGYV